MLDKKFTQRLSKIEQIVSADLNKLLNTKTSKGEITRPKQLLAAMRHGALNGGKRLRPFLVIETAKLFGVTGKSALRTATALECVHCYSLIHDDLPAMDDDDLRRGKPTVHKKWDDATAILAGDALLTLAFDILADPKTHKDATIRSELVLQLARAAGLGGMVGGQMLDLMAEKKTPNENGIKQLQAMKTGALLRFACEAGAIVGNASAKERKAMIKFGEYIGQAFQLADDILDVTATTEQMGKKVAKDQGKGKGTLVALYGIESAQKQADALVTKAIKLLKPYGKKAEMLSACAEYIVTRKH